MPKDGVLLLGNSNCARDHHDLSLITKISEPLGIMFVSYRQDLPHPDEVRIVSSGFCKKERYYPL